MAALTDKRTRQQNTQPGDELEAACKKAARVLTQREITRLWNDVWAKELPGSSVVISGDRRRAQAAKTLLRDLGGPDREHR